MQLLVANPGQRAASHPWESLGRSKFYMKQTALPESSRAFPKEGTSQTALATAWPGCLGNHTFYGRVVRHGPPSHIWGTRRSFEGANRA